MLRSISAGIAHVDRGLIIQTSQPIPGQFVLSGIGPGPKPFGMVPTLSPRQMAA
jgi:hypothetical protein